MTPKPGPARRTGAATLALLVALAASPAATVAGSLPHSGLTLVGVVLREVDPSFAVIEDPETSRPGSYGVGAAVRGGRVTAIDAGRVTIEFGEGRMQLRLATPSTADRQSVDPAAGPERTQSAPEGARRRAGGTSDAGAPDRRSADTLRDLTISVQLSNLTGSHT